LRSQKYPLYFELCGVLPHYQIITNDTLEILQTEELAINLKYVQLYQKMRSQLAWRGVVLVAF
jgi:hypothetical protein